MEKSEPEFEAKLEAGKTDFDQSDVVLLHEIERQGSLKKATEKLGRSYAHSHERLDELEDEFGELVERQRGGSGGGGSKLTENAENLLMQFERIQTEFTSVADAEESIFEGGIIEEEGELVVIETPAGRLKAVVPKNSGVESSEEQRESEKENGEGKKDGDRARVSVRADTVTLNEPEDAPDEDSTSARNRFRGEVTRVEMGKGVAKVHLDVQGEKLVALVTLDSVSRLDIEEGSELVASFKATATRGIRLPN